MVLVAAFGSLRDAEVAARFLNDWGVPTRAIPLATAMSGDAVGGEGPRRISRPVGYAAFGAVLIGLVGTLLWSALLPDVLDTGWRAAATMLGGAGAGCSIGMLVENGLAPTSAVAPGGPAIGDDRAVLAVRDTEVTRAAGLLRRIGVDRILAGDDGRQ